MSKNLVDQFLTTVKDANKEKTKAFDTTAEVLRVEDKTAWVHFPGGADETPVQLTMNATRGDTVRVRVAGGRAWITGNSTSPPTDDTTANKARDVANGALEQASAAQTAANAAQIAADSAQASATAAAEAAHDAQTAADTAWEHADDANDAAIAADAKAVAAGTAADAAQTSADAAQRDATAANSAANGALNSLSTVQDIIGVLNWARDNASYTLTSDTAIQPGKVYWTRTGSGTEADPYVYDPVVTPVVADLGTYYEISNVDEAMADYINTHLALTDEGLYVLADDDAQNPGWKVLVAHDGVYIINELGEVMAKYMDAIVLGDENKMHARIDYRSLQLVTKEGKTYFHVSDLRNKEGRGEDVFYGDGSETVFYLSATPDTSYTKVSVDGVEVYNYTRTGETVTFNQPPSQGSQITVNYVLQSASNPQAFTFGRRAQGGPRPVGRMSAFFGQNGNAGGFLSFAHGGNANADGDYSFASGRDCRARGDCAHVEGNLTLATGVNSHAEGYDTSAYGESSHSEGCNSIANGNYAHAEGYRTQALGAYSHAQNAYTKATYDYQTVIGNYNDNNANAFEIGNGKSDSERSNAFSVSWTGDVQFALSATSLVSPDKELYDSIVALGWESEVIE